MSDMLSIGTSGVRAYQTALSTTSENIANAGSSGYVRRTATVREVSATSGTGGATGLGATVSGIVRGGDVFRAAEVRSSSAELAKTETGAAWLQRIEDALTGGKLGDRITAFFTSATQVAADPASLAPRAAMLEAASSLASAFAATGSALDAAALDLDATADAAMSELNGLSAALAKVNSGLARAPAGTSGAAALMDQRDQLLEQMSAITDIAVTFDGPGRALVRAGGANGPILVQGDSAGSATYVRNDEGAVSYSVYFGGESHAMAPMAGALAGVVEGAQRIVAARDQLETIARSLAEGVNDIQGDGRDLLGDGGEPMFEIGDPASRLTLILSDPRGIAAAAVGGGVRDNSNLLRLQTLRSSGKFESGVADMTAANGAALSARRTVAEAQSAMRDSAVAARDAATGVNIDEEAVDLLRFQQAYQASSRVIQIARETLQSILDIR